MQLNFDDGGQGDFSDDNVKDPVHVNDMDVRLSGVEEHHPVKAIVA